MAGTPGPRSARQGQRALAGRQAAWWVAWLPPFGEIGVPVVLGASLLLQLWGWWTGLAVGPALRGLGAWEEQPGGGPASQSLER